MDLELGGKVVLVTGGSDGLGAAVARREAGGGSIVNVLAVGAKAPGANSMPSSVSRAAGMALTKALSKELGPAGIRVNAVHRGRGT
ncbi:SDR family NAD(P)-dependent oxidoreductase [Archangium sp.]|uniref:SDR family NAD(P)-dependent oxidoreductase n=1 Tax=Archangium sp. TaxID=1872627 RepID=UPI00286A3086|nr:SDR family NAD(P)-dependent oxidoreductase [Archangium sp.]